MSKLPDPLVPLECTTVGNDWFPLHFQRLRKSKWWRRASDTARARNVMMWGEAYQSVPAGSLPDDDDELAEAAGYGMDVESFLAVKAEIMAPWVLCSDGRWYHPTVCEVVLDAWAKTSERRKREAERKARQRASVRGVPPPPPPVTRTTEKVPEEIDDVPRDTSEIAQDIATQERTDSRGQNPPNPPGGESEQFKLAWEAFPARGRGNLARATAWAAWWIAAVVVGSEDRLLGAVRTYAASEYILGGGKPRRFDRWLADGAYDAHLDPTAGMSRWNGPADIHAAVANAHDAAWADSWLGRCTYRDLPHRALISSNGFVVDTLRREVGSALTALGVRVLQENAA